jgi:hypothetical protein
LTLDAVDRFVGHLQIVVNRCVGHLQIVVDRCVGRSFGRWIGGAIQDIVGQSLGGAIHDFV